MENIPLHKDLINPPEESLHQLFSNIIENGQKILTLFVEQKDYVALGEMSYALNYVKDVIIKATLKQRPTTPKLDNRENPSDDSWITELENKLLMTKNKS